MRLGAEELVEVEGDGKGAFGRVKSREGGRESGGGGGGGGVAEELEVGDETIEREARGREEWILPERGREARAAAVVGEREDEMCGCHPRGGVNWVRE